MKIERIKALLAALGSKQTGYRAGWVEAPCPLARWNHINGQDAHPSFGIKKDDTKKSLCKCLSCGFGGDLMDLMFLLKGKMRRDPNPKINLSLVASIVSGEFDDMEFSFLDIPDYGAPKKSPDHVFPESWLASFQSILKFPEALTYCRKRMMSKQTLLDLDVRYDPMQKRVCFPFRNFKGELMGVQGRSIEEIPFNNLRYYQYGIKDKQDSTISHRNLHAWMGEHTLDLDKPIILLEGPFDYASVWRLYHNVAASFTSGLAIDKVKRIGDAPEVITLYDYGSGGNSARKRIKEVLKKTPIKHCIPTEEQGDAGNMSDSDLFEMLEGLVPLLVSQ